MQWPGEVSLPPGPPRGRLGLPAPRPLPLPATPPPPQPASPPLSAPLSALYSSAFAQDCEAIALQLQAEDLRWPEPPAALWLRRASTIEAETLTPLGPSCSFLSEAGRTPAARGAWTPPSRRPQQPPPCSSNRTYEYQGEASTAAGPSPSSSSWASGGGGDTYLCEGSSPRLSTASLAAVAGARFPASLADDDDDCAARRRTFEWELPAAAAAAGGDGSAPLVTSTPLLVVADQGPEPLSTDAQRRGSALLRSAPEGPAGRPKPGSGGKTTTTTPRGSSALRKKLVSTAAAKRSALPTRRKGLLAPEASPGAAGPPAKAGPRGAELPGGCLQRSGGPGASAGCAGQSQALAKKQLPVETKKAQTKLPCSKRLPLSIQPPSRLNRGPAAGAAGDNRIAKARAQKRPQEKPSDTVSTQKHPFLKQAYQGRGQTEKPTSGVLPAAGQTCRNTSGTGSAAFCFECPRLLEENQRLLKENQQLKIMLDKYCHKQNMSDSLSL